jgi:hypothetical protein
MAWKRESLPFLALPPAELPSTINNSHSFGSLLEQSLNFPGKVEISIEFFRRVFSLAALAAKRAS